MQALNETVMSKGTDTNILLI